MSNQARLNQFVADAIAKGGEAHLLKSAERVRSLLTILGQDGPTPAHLVGLSADDLFDAMMCLEAAAAKREAA